MAYSPIEDYGAIGDCHTVALVCCSGSIDWLCFPAFDSPSVFGAILDDKKGGSWAITPLEDNYKSKQMYIPDTNVLITRFFAPSGMAEITDLMPIEEDQKHTWNHRLLRQVRVIHGTFRFRMTCHPAFDYARVAHTVVSDDNGVVFRTPALSLGLSSELPLEITDTGAVTCEFTLNAHESTTFVLHRAEHDGDCSIHISKDEADAILQETVTFWRDWLAQCTYTGRWRSQINRSALVLKLLTYAPTGAIVAAPTTSLPEGIGQERNWDYRYTWIRDASFTCYAFLALGFYNEAARFMEWVQARCKELDPSKGGLQIMYGIDGRHDLPEITLDHLSGYRDSKPVRIGNGAYTQLQLDIYGELMDAMYLYNKNATVLPYDLWVYLRELTDWLCANWQTPDDGLWEVRSGKQNFVYSRVMTWVALDRAVRIANFRGLPANIDLWERTRSAVYEEIMTKGWSEKRQAFVQYYGSDTLDASNLLMPLVKFIGATDPRMLATLDRTLEELTYDALVFRYDRSQGARDGLEGDEGTFSLCSFWLVECLTRAGRLDDARIKLEKMLSYGNHLGLFSEEIGTSGEALGNYPQAFTHLSLISAAINLDRALNKGRRM